MPTPEENNLNQAEDPITTAPEKPSLFESGVFVVGESGFVNLDYLYDGGAYKGEVAIFSIEGMEEFEPGSQEFIKAAAERSLSNPDLKRGHVVISDAKEGAQYTKALGDYYNEDADKYDGAKTVEMNPGDKFAIMLVPNGTVQEVFDNPAIEGANRPLFSLATANPNDAFHVGQVADLTGDGSAFVMEDLRVDSSKGSDKDYNDVIFQVTGAEGTAISLDELIEQQNLTAARAWRESSPGKQLLAKVKQVIEENPFVLAPPPSEEDAGATPPENSTTATQDAGATPPENSTSGGEDAGATPPENSTTGGEDAGATPPENSTTGTQDVDATPPANPSTATQDVGVTAQANLSSTAEDGILIGDKTGSVSVDLLGDDSNGSISEAVQLPLSTSELGHVAISDATEAAKLSVLPEEPLGDAAVDLLPDEGKPPLGATAVDLLPDEGKPPLGATTVEPVVVEVVATVVGDALDPLPEDAQPPLADASVAPEIKDAVLQVTGATGTKGGVGVGSEAVPPHALSNDAIAPDADGGDSEQGKISLPQIKLPPQVSQPYLPSWGDLLAGGDNTELFDESSGNDSGEEMATISQGAPLDEASGNATEDESLADAPMASDRLIMGDAANNVLESTATTHIVIAREGDDFVFGGDGNEDLFGNQGNDVVFGGKGDDILHGGKDKDILCGDVGNDTIYGDVGEDTLIGGAGKDMLWGGEGKDTFVLAANSGADAIADFVLGEDMLSLSAGLTFDQLTITQGTDARAGDTLIRLTGSSEILVSLTGVEARDITSAAFRVT